MARFEYMLCLSQQMYVTFVNGRWQGELPPKAPQALESCPELGEFLQRVGQSGWELVSVTSDHVSEKDETLTTLYLKRERPDR